MHFDSNTLIAAGVFAHLLLSLGKLVFTKPKQQAQIAALGAKADTILGEVQAVVALLPATTQAQDNQAQDNQAQDNQAQKGG